LIGNCLAQHQFKLQNGELSSFKIDLEHPGGHTLVSRRYAAGITFTEDQTTGRLKAFNGLCVRTGPGTLTRYLLCGKNINNYIFGINLALTTKVKNRQEKIYQILPKHTKIP